MIAKAGETRVSRTALFIQGNVKKQKLLYIHYYLTRDSWSRGLVSRLWCLKSLSQYLAGPGHSRLGQDWFRLLINSDLVGNSYRLNEKFAIPMVRLKIGQMNHERARCFPICLSCSVCLDTATGARWLAATDFSPWDLRSSYPYFADDQPTVGIFFLISDMNQVLLSLLLDYVETN